MSQGYDSFGALLRTHRGAVNLTQEELASRAGLSVDAISMLERGERRAPRASTVDCLATALGLDQVQRGAFAAAAKEVTGRAPNGQPRTHAPTDERASDAWRLLRRRLFGARLSAFPALALILALGLGATLLVSRPNGGLVRGLPLLASSQTTSASVAQPSVTGLSVTPSTLKVTKGSYTTINFHLNVDARVSLRIADSRGWIETSILDNVPKPAGIVSRNFYGWSHDKPLSSGEYTVVVAATADGATFTAHAPLTIQTLPAPS